MKKTSATLRVLDKAWPVVVYLPQRFFETLDDFHLSASVGSRLAASGQRQFCNIAALIRVNGLFERLYLQRFFFLWRVWCLRVVLMLRMFGMRACPCDKLEERVSYDI